MSVVRNEEPLFTEMIEVTVPFFIEAVGYLDICAGAAARNTEGTVPVSY